MSRSRSERILQFENGAKIALSFAVLRGIDGGARFGADQLRKSLKGVKP